jgi:hypothetical protein
MAADPCVLKGWVGGSRGGEGRVCDCDRCKSGGGKRLQVGGRRSTGRLDRPLTRQRTGGSGGGEDRSGGGEVGGGLGGGRLL